jgi:hypothetical protein
VEPGLTRFASEDEEATYWLSLLRDGDRHQQVVARERLSQIFERRGLLDEAAQCLESNIREGVRDPRVYQRLAGVYRRQGRHELADEVLVEARRLAERLARPQPPGTRRPGPGRPVRPVSAPPPHPLEAPTARLPASAAPGPPRPPAPPPASAGELELDRQAAGPPTGPAAPAWSSGRAASSAGRPWWLSPGMLVLLILLCGPYGLALMWVRGGYSKQARLRATAVWAGLVVLVLAAVAVMLQAQLAVIVAGAGGPGAVASSGAAPTPVVFGTPAASAKPTLPPGLASPPPTLVISPAPPAALASSPAATAIGPDPVGAAEPTATAQTVEQPPALAPAPPAGERARVTGTGDTGANLRERPGQAGQVIKTVPEGAIVQVVGADQQMDGKGWRNVRDEAGTQGWMVADFLEAAP